MKKIFEKFAELNYNLDDFYAIRFMGGKVYLQGNANQKILDKYEEDFEDAWHAACAEITRQALGYKFEFDSVNKWIDANLLMDDLTVVITLVLP